MVVITLKKGELAYIGIIVVALILSVWVAIIEFISIGNLDKSIMEREGKISELDEILDRIEHLENLQVTYYTIGKSLDSQREEIKLDRVGAVSIEFNLKVQSIVFEECLTVNSASGYLGKELNCSKVRAEEAFFDDSELRELGKSIPKLNKLNADLKGELSKLKSEKQGKMDFRNLLYVFVVFLSGLGIAWRWGMEKWYSN